MCDRTDVYLPGSCPSPTYAPLPKPIIQSAKLNGQPFERVWIYHSEIVVGETLEFEMGPRPNPHWAARTEDARRFDSRRRDQALTALLRRQLGQTAVGRNL